MRTKYLVCVVVCLCSMPVYAADYGKEVQKAVKKVLKRDYRRYQFFGVPMSNFGTGTMYPKAATGETFDPTISGLFGDPNTWWTVSKDEAQKQLELLRPPSESGPITLSDISKKKFSLSAVVPELFALLNVSGGFNWDKAVTVTLTADNIVNHRINWSNFSKQKDAKMIDDQVLAHIDANDYLITTGDLVMENFKVRVTVNRTLDVNAEAKLKAAVAQLSKDAKATFAYKSSTEGSLELTSKKPVVVAVFIAAPPPGGVREAATKPPVENQIALPRQVLQRLEAAGVKNEIAVK